MALVFGETWTWGALFFVSLLEVGLGIYVARLAWDRPYGRLLAASLLCHAIALGPAFGFWFVRDLVWELDPGGFPSYQAVAFVMLLSFGSAVPALDLAFGLAYPRPARLIVGRAWLMVAALLPALALATWGVLSMRVELGALSWDVSDEYREIGTLLALAWILAGWTATAIVLALRAKRAPSRLTGQRLRFMRRAYALPLVSIVLAAALLIPLAEGLLALGVPPEWIDDGFGNVLVPALVVGATLVPPVAVTYGLLRYRLLDWDARVRRTTRWTLSRGFVVALAVAAFFLVTELAETLLVPTSGSRWVGLVGAALIAVAARPLERAALRAIDRAVPSPNVDSPAVRRRRLDVYRAEYEDVRARRELTWEDRRRLDELARRVGLSPAAVRALEDEPATTRKRP